MVSCNILLRLGTAENLSRFLRPFTKVLFGLEGVSAFPFFLGILSGYPTGAKLTAQLYKKNLISKEDAQHLLTFSNNPGPLFLIGTIGVGFFGIPFFGHLLLLSSILSAVTTGILWRFFHKNLLCNTSDMFHPKPKNLFPTCFQLPSLTAYRPSFWSADI